MSFLRRVASYLCSGNMDIIMAYVKVDFRFLLDREFGCAGVLCHSRMAIKWMAAFSSV